MRKLKGNFLKLILLTLSIVINSCIEEFTPQTVTFENVLVIEATITNEFKNQTIKLSRTQNFESIEAAFENNAQVSITTNTNVTYNFTDAGEGIYTSQIPFQAEPDVDYQLSILTSDRKQYTSEITQLTGSGSQIESIKAILGENDLGQEGVTIALSSFDPDNNSEFYGYEFEETYEIFARRWEPFELVITDRNPFSFDIVRKTKQDRICYNTIPSQGRIITSSNLVSEDRITNFPITFFPIDDIRISTRYSILIRQFTQSRASYDFYRVMNELSNIESVFSQTQPGFISGNISSVTNADEKVIGFFEVSSVSEQRYFVNRSEILEGDYLFSCTVFQPDSFDILERVLDDGSFVFFAPGDPNPIPFLVSRECADCTVYGSNIKPDFWID